MSDRDPRAADGGAGAGSPGDDPVQLGRADEILYIQERYQQEPKPSAPATAVVSPPPASDLLAAAPPDAAPTRTVAARPPGRGLDAARLVTAVLALLLAAAFFYPAIHDALDRRPRLLGPARAGQALEAPADAWARAGSGTTAYLSIDATPAGARVIIDGVERGTTPLLANVPCLTGSQVTVELTATGHAPWRTTVTCARDLVFAIAPALARAPAPGR